MVDYVFERHLSGGILLPAHKERSTTPPISRGFVPTTLVLARGQHRGSAAVHASTSGVVRAIDERTVLGGHGVQPSPCVVIEGDDCPTHVMLTERFRVAKRTLAVRDRAKPQEPS